QRQKEEEASEAPAPPMVTVLAVDLMILDVYLLLLSHVADREEMNKRGDERHHQKHDAAEVVDLEADLKSKGLSRIVLRAKPNPVSAACPVRLEFLGLLLVRVQFGGEPLGLDFASLLVRRFLVVRCFPGFLVVLLLLGDLLLEAVDLLMVAKKLTETD